MGRAAKRKKDTPAQRIRLERADYFELKSLMTNIEKAQLQAEAVKNAIVAAQAQAGAKLTALAAAHGFDAQKPYRLDEATCSLVAVTTDGR